MEGLFHSPGIDSLEQAVTNESVMNLIDWQNTTVLDLLHEPYMAINVSFESCQRQQFLLVRQHSPHDA